MGSLKRLSTAVACVYCHEVVVMDDDTCAACQAIIEAEIAALHARPKVLHGVAESARVPWVPRVQATGNLTGQVFRGRSEY